MILTTTQYSSYSGCPRQWWFRKGPAKMPKQTSDAFLPGSVLHACLERIYHCRGTMTVPEHNHVFERGEPLYGQIPGAKVDIFPPRWTEFLDRDGTWSTLAPEWVEKIPRMVRSGFDSGAIDVPTDAIVEDKFSMEIIPGVWMESLADVLSVERREVQDHKSAAAKKWLRTPSELANDPQILIYGKRLLDVILEMEGEEAEWIKLRHNGYIKRPTLTGNFTSYPIYAELNGSDKIPAEHVMRAWETLQADAREMVSLVETYTEENDWEKVPGAHKASTCEKYGGCAFSSICHHGMSPDVVRRGLTGNLSLHEQFTAAKTSTKTSKMQSPLPVPPPPSQQKAAPAPSPAPAPPVAAAPAAPAAPQWPRSFDYLHEKHWLEKPLPFAQQGCISCDGTGVRNGKVCPVCVSHYDGPGKPNLVVVESTDGSKWFVLGEPVELVSTVPQPAPEPEPVAGQAPEAPQAAPAPPQATPTPDPTPTAAPPPAPQPEAAAVTMAKPKKGPGRPKKNADGDEPKRGPGRPKKDDRPVSAEEAALIESHDEIVGTPLGKSYALILGRAATVRRGRKVIQLEPLIQAAMGRVAAKFGVTDYYDAVGSDNTPWARREHLARMAEFIIPQIGGAVVVYMNPENPETRGLLERLTAHAWMVA